MININLPKFDIPKIIIPRSEMINLHIPIDKSKYPAWWTCGAVLDYIKEFENKLDTEIEIWMRLVSFWNIIFHLQDVRSEEPSLITFYGVNEKWEPLQLIQNLAQLNILLIGVKKIWEKATRIWFKVD